MEDKLKVLCILLEGNSEADHLKVLKMNFLILQYCKESADIIQKPLCAIKFFEEQKHRKIPTSNGTVS